MSGKQIQLQSDTEGTTGPSVGNNLQRPAGPEEKSPIISTLCTFLCSLTVVECNSPRRLIFAPTSDLVLKPQDSKLSSSQLGSYVDATSEWTSAHAVSALL